MSRRCEICGKGPLSSASRSHSNIKTKRRLYLNLQTKKINGKKTKVCANCLKTMNKAK
ncbi:50S ribosomal protein L28 [Patescibacteria group bacterium]|nr:50S ribosomal protein L28 [Patescibacteria group bacterium]